MIGLVGFALSTLGPAGASEAERDQGERHAREVLVVPFDRVVNEDYFALGERVEISGTVNGDVYILAGQVLVDGTINGDLLAAAGTITISGNVSQDARLAGGQITLSGDVRQNLTLVGGTVDLTPGATVGGGVVAAAGNIQLDAPVDRSATLAAANVVLTAQIKENVTAAAAAIRLSSSAVIGGNLTYVSPQRASIDERATVAGTIMRREGPEKALPSTEKFFAVVAAMSALFFLMNFVSTLLLGLALIHFYPNATAGGVTQLTEQPLAVIGLGTVTVVLGPLMIILLAITVVGIPLASLLLIWFASLLYVGRIFPIQWLGVWMLQRFGKAHRVRVAFVSGLIVYSLLAAIPFIGWLVTLLACVAGMGSTLFLKKRVYHVAREQALA